MSIHRVVDNAATSIAAADTFKTWNHVSAVARCELLLLLCSPADELVAVQMEETNAPALRGWENIDWTVGLIE